MLVSQGPRDAAYVMPHFVGMTEVDAAKRLEAAGLKKNVNYVTAPQWPHGSVIDQAPLAGARVGAEEQAQSHSHGDMAAHAPANAAATAAVALRDAGAKPVTLAPYVDALPRLPVIHPYKMAQGSAQVGATAQSSAQAPLHFARIPS